MCLVAQAVKEHGGKDLSESDGDGHGDGGDAEEKSDAEDSSEHEHEGGDGGDASHEPKAPKAAKARAKKVPRKGAVSKDDSWMLGRFWLTVYNEPAGNCPLVDAAETHWDLRKPLWFRHKQEDVAPAILKLVMDKPQKAPTSAGALLRKTSLSPEDLQQPMEDMFPGFRALAEDMFAGEERLALACPA